MYLVHCSQNYKFEGPVSSEIEAHLGTVHVLFPVKALSHCGKEGLFEETFKLKLVWDSFIPQKGNKLLLSPVRTLPPGKEHEGQVRSHRAWHVSLPTHLLL